MAKVRASLADVKTQFEQAPPARYRLRVEKIDEKISKAEGDPTLERQNFNIEVKIADGGEHNGKPIYHNVSLHTKKGEPNQAGQADLKRFFMGCLGLPEDDEFFMDESNLDTDLILKKEFDCDVYIESYDNTATGGKKGKANRLQTTSITPPGGTPGE